MSIANAEQRGDRVYVYDKYGHELSTIPAGNQPGDGLKGFTSSTVTIQIGSRLCTYDAGGNLIGSTSAK
ncbi:MAG: hypothetical protein ABFD91_13770 [Anaerohalosphaeraceae bacterium]|nr:hypothetical protein [Anaerohalosphaeraceae bacterium]